jgi:hypothetical protein
MPSGSVSVMLSISTGKLDRILYATAYLCQRLQTITLFRQRRGMDNIFPSTAEIKTSHLFIFDVSFKPCIIVAQEYVRQQAKNPCLGSDVDYEPKFACDYANDMYFEDYMPEISASSAALGDIIVEPFDQNLFILNQNTATNFGQGRLAQAGELTNFIDGFTYGFPGAPNVPVNAVVNYGSSFYTLRIAANNLEYGRGDISYIYTDASGNFIAGPDGKFSQPDANGFGTGAQLPAVVRANYVRAAELPGIKLHDEVLFQVDNNEIARYHSSFAVNYRERFLTKGVSRDQYDRLIGQSVPYDYIHEKQIQHDSNVQGLGTDMPVLSVHQEYTKVTFGLQTPVPVIPRHTLITPVLFWFCMKRKDSIPIVCLPDANIIVRARKVDLSRLYYVAPGDLYIQETIYLNNNASPPFGSMINPNVKIQNRVPFLIPGSTVVSKGALISHLNMCHMYLDDCVHTILLHRIGFHLIRIIRRSVISVKETETEIELNGIKWPVEYVFVRDIPYENTDETNPKTADNWYRCGHQNWIPAGEVCTSTYPNDTVVINLGLPVYQTIWEKSISQCVPGQIRVTTDAVVQFGVTIYDTVFFEKQMRKFYSDYIPYAYCNGFITGNDESSNNIMFNFAQIPGYSNPNGHFNVSKTRSVVYRVDVVLGPNGKVALISDTVCLNFIIISDGSMVVRYM